MVTKGMNSLIEKERITVIWTYRDSQQARKKEDAGAKTETAGVCASGGGMIGAWNPG